jgi:hypothetical protein
MGNRKQEIEDTGRIITGNRRDWRDSVQGIGGTGKIVDRE